MKDHQAFANTIYAKANQVVLVESLKFGFLGGIIFLALELSILSNSQPTAIIYFLALILGGLIGGYFGHQSGLMKSIQLKLEAQRTLCFVQIEVNSKSVSTEGNTSFEPRRTGRETRMASL